MFSGWISKNRHDRLIAQQARALNGRITELEDELTAARAAAGAGEDVEELKAQLADKGRQIDDLETNLATARARIRAIAPATPGDEPHTLGPEPVHVRIQEGSKGGWRPIVVKDGEPVFPVQVSGLASASEADALARSILRVESVEILTYAEVKAEAAKRRKERRKQ